MEFNEKLQKLRKQKGLTQEELAKSLYVSRTAISKWEAGRGYPNIESLRAIAKFFSVSLDDLLSADEILTLAEEDGRQRENGIRDLVFGLLDVCMLSLLFLPLFADRSGEAVKAVSLIALGEVPLYLKILYFSLVCATPILGVLILALQNVGEAASWHRAKTTASLLLSFATALAFIVSSHPYAALFAFSMLSVKVLLLIKR